MSQTAPRSLQVTWLQGLADHLVPPEVVDGALTFRDFHRATSHHSWNIDYPYIAYLREALQSVTDGECRRLAIFMPPRHGKSETATVRYPVFRVERRPETRCVIAAHTQALATKFGRKALRIAQSRMTLAADRCAAPEWETVQGGGVRAVGVGGAIAGSGFDLLLIDDPIRTREEAESEEARQKAWDWYTDDLYTRQEPGAAIILVQTRWHEDDLAGRILNSEQASKWTVVSLAAIAEEDDPLGRAVGEALCPDRFPMSELQDIKRVETEYAFDALYQQRPSPREGFLFKVTRIGIVKEAPSGLPRCRAWDVAATAGSGDWTAGVLLAGPDSSGLWYVLDVVRGRWSSDERNARIVKAAREDGLSVKIMGAQDPGSAGVDAGNAFTRMLAGFTVKTQRVTGSKETRADPFSAQVNAGNVRIVEGDWNGAFVNELRTFPGGKHDDQVDAVSDGFTELTRNQWGDWV